MSCNLPDRFRMSCECLPRLHEPRTPRFLVLRLCQGHWSRHGRASPSPARSNRCVPPVQFPPADSRLVLAASCLGRTRHFKLRISCFGLCFCLRLHKCCLNGVLSVCTHMRGLQLIWSIVTGADSCFVRPISWIQSCVAITRSKKL